MPVKHDKAKPRQSSTSNQKQARSRSETPAALEHVPSCDPPVVAAPKPHVMRASLRIRCLTIEAETDDPDVMRVVCSHFVDLLAGGST